jgi:hypothetical protein
VTLPGLDLTPLVTAINNNTEMLETIVGELAKMNEDKQADMERQVNVIRNALDTQYRGRIEQLEKLVPKGGQTFFPFGEPAGSSPGTTSVE